jgi:hypothetical protein
MVLYRVIFATTCNTISDLELWYLRSSQRKIPSILPTIFIILLSFVCQRSRLAFTSVYSFLFSFLCYLKTNSELKPSMSFFIYLLLIRLKLAHNNCFLHCWFTDCKIQNKKSTLNKIIILANRIFLMGRLYIYIYITIIYAHNYTTCLLHYIPPQVSSLSYS